MYFDVYGPYEITKGNGEICGKQSEFWESVEANAANYGVVGLDKAVGCYLFALCYKDRYTPWYVGMTTAQSGFRGEIFQRHKLDIYEECIKARRGTPVMFFFPMLTGSGNFSKAYKSNRVVVSWLEKMLMGLAYGRNPDLGNQRDMKFLRNCVVNGVLGPPIRGRPYREVTKIRRTLLG